MRIFFFVPALWRVDVRRRREASIMLKRRNNRPGAASFGLSLVAALTMSAAPALAQGNCKAALQPILQARSQILLNYANAQTKLANDRQNAMLDCIKKGIAGSPNSGAAVAQCQKSVGDTYQGAEIDLQKDENDALTQESIVENNVAHGPSCNWTPEEISQFVASVGQAASQLAQGAAQIISAAKGKAATATAPGKAPPTKPPAGGSGSGSGTSSSGSGSNSGGTGTTP